MKSYSLQTNFYHLLFFLPIVHLSLHFSPLTQTKNDAALNENYSSHSWYLVLLLLQLVTLGLKTVNLTLIWWSECKLHNHEI